MIDMINNKILPPIRLMLDDLNKKDKVCLVYFYTRDPFDISSKYTLFLN